MKVLVIDNYDSFTYNLVDYIASASSSRLAPARRARPACPSR